MVVGTTIKVQATTSATPTTIKISVYDPSDVEKVSLQDMTDEGANVYTYLYQNTASDEAGEYTVLITAVTSTYTSKSKRTFRLEAI